MVWLHRIEYWKFEYSIYCLRDIFVCTECPICSCTWVELTLILDVPLSAQFCLGRWLGNMDPWWNIQDLSQPNSSARADWSPCIFRQLPCYRKSVAFSSSMNGSDGKLHWICMKTSGTWNLIRGTSTRQFVASFTMIIASWNTFVPTTLMWRSSTSSRMSACWRCPPPWTFRSSGSGWRCQYQGPWRRRRSPPTRHTCHTAWRGLQTRWDSWPGSKIVSTSSFTQCWCNITGMVIGTAHKNIYRVVQKHSC